MSDRDCVRFLERALPRIGLRWEGFRRNHRQVCRRVRARIRELGLEGLDAYASRLDEDPSELGRLDSFARVTISRFFRDAAVFERIRRALLPQLAERARVAGERTLRALSVGCASGEEPYTLAAIFSVELGPRFPDLSFRVVGIDAGEAVLARARRASYEPGSLRELPPELREAAFEREGAELRLRSAPLGLVDLLRGDVRRDLPAGPFDLVLCRNMAFTYFDEASQRAMLESLAERMHPWSCLVIGAGERLPEGAHGFELTDPEAHSYRKNLAPR